MNKQNPFTMLLHSRKFWITSANAFVSISLYIAAMTDPAWVDHIKFLVGVLQIPFGILVATITVEDIAKGRRRNNE